ncbi:unnamed protein product, partial [Effrenium voratum]
PAAGNDSANGALPQRATSRRGRARPGAGEPSGGSHRGASLGRSEGEGGGAALRVLGAGRGLQTELPAMRPALREAAEGEVHRCAAGRSLRR